MIYMDATAVFGKVDNESWTSPANIIQKQTLKEGIKSKKPSKIPNQQQALILPALREPYQLTKSHPTPAVTHGDELIIRTHTVGRESHA
jgi:hypothetical protein